MSPPPAPSVDHGSPPSAILFDLDGTLVESRRDIAEALNRALSAIGREQLALEAVVPMIGDGARVLVARALGPDAADEALLERTLARFQEAYAAAPCVHTTLLPGAREALSLRVPRGLVTNKPRAITTLVIGALGIGDAFEAVYAGGDGPLKPAPDGVLRAAARLGVRASEVWLVGDGPQDVLAGKAAGCVTIAVPGIAERDRVLEAGPDVVAGSLEEVARLARARGVTAA